jgi:hypothetical protein
MKHSDESVEKVLAALRDVGPAIGMERRILEAVERRASERKEASWWQRNSSVFRPSPKRVLFCGATLAVVVQLLVSPKLPRHEHMSSVSTSPPQPAANVVRTSITGVSGIEKRSITQSTSAISQTPQAVHVQRVKAIHADRSDGSSLALREMTAASHPAPPLPLTLQERLLLQVIHKGDPVELAMLNPEVRARHVAEARAEFQEFFKPKTGGDAQ